MAFKPLVAVVLCILVSSLILGGVEGGRFKRKERNSVITTAKTVYGDVYNCIDIEKQPSLRDPTLANHKVQIRPGVEYSPKNLFKHEDNDTFFRSIWLGKGCPLGTVPISKIFPTTKSSSEKSLNSSLVGSGQVEFAGVRIRKGGPGTEYNGVSASINLFNNPVGAHQSTSAAISFDSGVNQIEVGWTVYPDLYPGDQRTRMFIRWTRDNHVRTGCYNLHCPGFVLVDAQTPVDFFFPFTSVIEGPKFDVDLGIHQESTDKNWWLTVYQKPVGYWPKSLFDSLNNGADAIRIGGQVSSPGAKDTFPKMGSGLFVGGQTEKTCYVRKVNVQLKGQPSGVPFASLIDNLHSNCYFAASNSFSKDPYWGYNFLFGGKGGKLGVTCLG